MSRDLMRALFERDLDEAEMDAIAASLRQDPAEAAHFADLAAAHYQSLGLKPPKLESSGSWKLWGSLGLGLLVSGLWVAWPAPPQQRVLPVVEAPVPAAVLAPVVTAPKPKAKPTRYAEGEQMRVEVELPRPMHVRVDLFDAQSRRLRKLYEGESPAGLNGYVFDGLDQNGNVLASGRYRVVVDYGGGVLEKWFVTK